MGRGEEIRGILVLQDELVHHRAAWDPGPWMDLDMSTPQLKALLIIASNGRMRMRELARRLGGSFSNATVLTDRLVDRGLVERLADPHDRRVVLVRVSEKGEMVVERLVTSWRTLSETLLERLGDEDLAALTRGLRALVLASRPEAVEEEAGALG